MRRGFTSRHARGDLSNRAAAVDVLDKRQLRRVESYTPIRSKDLGAGERLHRMRISGTKSRDSVVEKSMV
jgi:hypothetical protein